MDIIDRIQARFPTNIKIFPATVQGVNACGDIIEGLNFLKIKKLMLLLLQEVVEE